MSLRTFEQTVSDKVVERLRTRGNPNVTFLINNTKNVRNVAFQNAVADDFALDAQITSRKITNVPGAFTPNDRTIVLSEGAVDLENRGIRTLLRTATNVEFIVSIKDHFEITDFDNNFILLSEDKIRVGTTRDNTAETRVQLWQRERVFV